MIPIKFEKYNYLVYIKIDQENMFFENDDKSYTMVIYT